MLTKLYVGNPLTVVVGQPDNYDEDLNVGSVVEVSKEGESLMLVRRLENTLEVSIFAHGQWTGARYVIPDGTKS